MYGYGASSGNGIKAFCFSIVFLIIIAIVMGLALAGTELFDRSRAQAEADRIQAETEAIRAQTAYEEGQRNLELQRAQQQAAQAQRLREIELQKAEQKAAAELQALKEFQAAEAEFLQGMAYIGPIVLAIALLCPAFAASYYLIRKGIALQIKQIPKAPGNIGQHFANLANGAFQVQQLNISVCKPSYNGLLAFCEDFVLPNNRELPSCQHYEQPDNQRKYYPNGISADTAQAYLTILRRVGITTLEINGGLKWIRRQQIANLDVIRRRISREAFDKVVHNYLDYDLIELETLLAQDDGKPSESMLSTKIEPSYALG